MEAAARAREAEDKAIREELASTKAEIASLKDTAKMSMSIKSEFRDANENLQAHAANLEQMRKEENERANKTEAILALRDQELVAMKERAETAEAKRESLREKLEDAKEQTIEAMQGKIVADKRVKELKKERIQAQDREKALLATISQQAKERELERLEQEMGSQVQLQENLNTFEAVFEEGGSAGDAAAAFLRESS